ncbi:hypothetical protein B5F53_11780 [Blautia sp. An249]|uniref:hypothetical protein n=1 Tax=Blautia sp. An249 TaxID=1965603 RepID=UPI000B370393|nr:hypothetical protein [Blautia sp. An249]OUO78221.1 hypothetical protein B5F53_11780 [Blautia sp. An249]
MQKNRMFLYLLGAMSYIGVFIIAFLVFWEMTGQDAVRVLALSASVSILIGLAIFIKIEEIQDTRGGKDEEK